MSLEGLRRRLVGLVGAQGAAGVPSATSVPMPSRDPAVVPPQFLYARGFVLKRAPGEQVRGWRSHPVGKWWLSHDPRVPLQTWADGRRQAWLLGDAYDPAQATFASALHQLLEGSIEVNLDRLAGRYVLLVLENGKLYVYHDALGSRSVYYADGVVGSHAALVAEVIGAGLRDWIIPFLTSRGYQKRDVKYLPGLDAPYEGVRQLTPNTRLLLPEGRVERYWPREPRTDVDGATAVRTLVDQLRGLRDYVRATGKTPIIGLTGGRDSRGVLAALAGLEPSLFTFVRSKNGDQTNSADSRVARTLGAAYGLPLEIVKLNAPLRLDESDTPFARAFRRNTGYVRGGNSTWVEHFASEDRDARLYVRGFGGEVMRGFYGGVAPTTVSDLANTYDVNAGSRYTRAAFRTFKEVVGWDPDAFHGYPATDLFYWEHRMGIWGASTLTESDMAFRSMNGYTSRNLFTAFMGVPESERVRLFEEAVAALAPEIADVPYAS